MFIAHLAWLLLPLLVDGTDEATSCSGDNAPDGAMAEGGGCGCNALSRDAASEREGMNSIGEGKPSAVDASEQFKGTASSAFAVTEVNLCRLLLEIIGSFGS